MESGDELAAELLTAKTIGSLIGRTVIFFNEFIDEKDGSPLDKEWVDRARELRGRMMSEMAMIRAAKKNLKKG